MNSWTRKLAALLTGSLLLPIGGEVAASIMKGDQFNVARAGISVGVIGAAALALALARPRQIPARVVMSMFLIVAGLGTAVFGFLLTATPEMIEDGFVSDVVGASALCVGLFILSAGVLLLSEHRRSLPLEALALVSDADPPAIPFQLQLPPGHVKVTKFPGYRAESHDAVVELSRKRMSVKDLHYLAYHVNHAPVFRMDLLDDPDLGRFHEIVSPESRRASYDKHGRTLDRLMAKLNADFREMDSGVLIRLVLDVERGAIYYFLVHSESGRYLVGVTLDQDMVHVTDGKLAALVDEVRVHIGAPRIPELER
jgi:hypothetical protein